jgi:hypothetical protein
MATLSHFKGPDLGKKGRPLSSGRSLTSTDAKKTIHIYMEKNLPLGAICRLIVSEHQGNIR